MKIPRDKNGNLVCYWHYPGDSPRVLIPGCYGSLYDRPDYCNCPGGVFDPGKVVFKARDLRKLEKEIESLRKEVSELHNSQLELNNRLIILNSIPSKSENLP
ncbi:MAG: hypothetical protein IPL26_19910 [Leptospiraceae bacterium]|nr:hypothetical protein [Leptospiraceae bacterium]